MKKIFTFIFFFVFSLQPYSFANDISEYQIEGISVGDSLLEYMSREEIESNLSFVYQDLDKNIGKNVAQISYNKNLKIYDEIHLDFKTTDNIFEIIALNGILFYKDNVNECYQKQLQLVEELKLVFEGVEVKKDGPSNHPGYPNGEIKYLRYAFFINENEYSNLEVFCYDIVEELKKTDRLTLNLKSKEFNDYADKIYK
tara:strand:+ start:292 stop:888 length:597 start_codon:yes stop_codon:yes gene_type:complete